MSVRKATGFPPFSDVVRVLISNEDEENALLATKAIYEELKEFVYEKNKAKFYFFGCMKAPLKRLQNKFRFQVLMRIKANDKVLLDEIFLTINKYRSSKTQVVLEINSNNLS